LQCKHVTLVRNQLNQHTHTLSLSQSTLFSESKWGKFFGACNAASDALNRCLTAEFETRRSAALTSARSEDARLAQLMLQSRLRREAAAAAGAADAPKLTR
jgi:hypothetical protein